MHGHAVDGGRQVGQAGGHGDGETQRGEFVFILAALDARVCHEVDVAQGQALHARALSNGVEVVRACCGFYQRQQVHALEMKVQVAQSLAGLGFGHHQGGQTGQVIQQSQVVAPGGAGFGVDAQHQGQVQGLQQGPGLCDGLACYLFGAQGHAVFQVEHDGVGAAARGFFKTFRSVAWNEEQGAGLLDVQFFGHA